MTLEHSEIGVRFQTLLSSAPDAAVAIDRDGKIVLVNTKMESLFGYSQAELVGKAIEILVPERFRGHHTNHRSEFFSAPRARRMDSGADLYGLRKDATEFPVEISLGPVETDQGLLVWATILDVSERRALHVRVQRSLEEKESLLGRLRHQEALLRTIVDSIPALIVCKDADDDFRISLMNRAVVESVFRNTDVGKTIYDLVPKAQADEIMAIDASTSPRLGDGTIDPANDPDSDRHRRT